MVSKRYKFSVDTVRLHPAGQVQHTAVASRHYRDFLGAVLSVPVDDLQMRPVAEIEYGLSALAGQRSLRQALMGTLNRSRRSESRILVLEVAGGFVDNHIYDRICSEVDSAFTEAPSKVQLFVVSVAHPSVLKQSVVLEALLLPHCRDASTTVILLPYEDGEAPEVVVRGGTGLRHPLPSLANAVDIKPAPKGTTQSLVDSIDLLTGHFAWTEPLTGELVHLPAVASVSRLADSPELIETIQADFALRAKSSDFDVLPVGLLGGGLQKVARSLVGTHLDRLVSPNAMGKSGHSTAVILCDLLSDATPIHDLQSRLRKEGYKTILVEAFVELARDTGDDNGEAHSYTSLPWGAFSERECMACQQDSCAVPGETYDDYLASVSDYDSYTFWQLMAYDAAFLDIGHWKGDRTPNHYHFRIMAGPLMTRFGYELASRLRNALSRKGIIARWIHKIVIPNDPEARALARAMAERLGLEPTAGIIEIPRTALQSMAGPDLPEDARVALNAQLTALGGKNVIIVDQAAHHLKTLSALRKFCAHARAVVLAFAVVVDRTAGDVIEGDYLYDCHYVWLYSWPCAPRLGYECPCAKAHK